MFGVKPLAALEDVLLVVAEVVLVDLADGRISASQVGSHG
jgi:hypothetical protein